MNYPVPFLDYCDAIEIRLTSLRKAVLYILWQMERPLKAYEVLDNLLQTKENAAPPTVYRVLDYFVAAGVVHKIESIQSYTLCREPKKILPQEILMVCNQCRRVQEIYDEKFGLLIQKLSQHHYFQLNQEAIELKGLCRDCYTQ